ncbi:hypothetical protein BC939DRAFT_396636 [Gamsiella multidivaricata]|uniref:uncharacterized protein n=1 Tax=Gamsiella multidivaricata TaxID=101098 RepID=UPI002220B6FF|nr:uncharacterized protein BC939DRAFT_396636 [Gamsiella multidivaricata]KAG0367434.1 hypothetical protein BGZ54_003891 [Gamsiella multidivaricata]KAI7824339.1 hypothetical protein BC939DRAFT_396636 [Gamsiella multidivaricata]
MVKANNKSIIFWKEPEEYPIPGEHFGVELREIDENLDDNEVRTRNLYISLDPYLRGRMKGFRANYISGFQIGQKFDNLGIGEVVASRNPKIPVGSIVVGFLGWEEYSRVPATSQLKIIEGARESKFPFSSWVGVLGMPGFTAYASLLEIGKPKAGETIFVSAASGAVGQLVGQIAKRLGLRVIGSAGSDDKVAYLLKDLKFDAAFNYKKGNILESLRAAAPEGIDIYYENVGGETLEAALEVLNIHGRIVASGMISGYNTSTPYGIKNLIHVVMKRIRFEGFVVNDFSAETREKFEKDVSAWLQNGEIIYKEDVTVGLENAPDAFLGLLQGKNFGRAVVKITDL